MFTLVACLVVVGISSAAVLKLVLTGSNQAATKSGVPHRGAWRRLRSAVLLVLVVAVVGTLLAALIGVIVLALGLVLRSAVTG